MKRWFSVNKFNKVDRKLIPILAFLGGENDTFLYEVIIALAALSGILLLLLIGAVTFICKKQSSARNSIKKDVNPLYYEYYEDVEAKGKKDETKAKNEDPRSNSVDQHYDYDYMGS